MTFPRALCTVTDPSRSAGSMAPTAWSFGATARAGARARRAAALVLVLTAARPLDLAAQVAPPPIEPAGVPGTLFLAGGGRLPPEVLTRFVVLAGGEAGRLVVIPTATARAAADDGAETLAVWRERGLTDVVVLHTRDRTEADRPEFVAPLRTATAVWIGGGDQNRVAEAYLDTLVEAELRALLARGGVVGGTSAGTAVQSCLMIAGGRETARTARGFDHLPGFVLDQHFAARNRQARLAGVLAANPGHVGLGVDEGTALVVAGRRLDVVGRGSVHVLLAGGAGRPPAAHPLPPGAAADLVALRRAAHARAQPAAGVAAERLPGVAQGAVLVAAAGSLPAEVFARFVALAGGSDAKIVVVAPASDEGVADLARALAAAGAAEVVTVALDALATDGSVAVLQAARGVWLCDQPAWPLVDGLERPDVRAALHAVLSRGGVVAGAGAAASVLGDDLLSDRGDGAMAILFEGYAHGLGLLPWCAIEGRHGAGGLAARPAVLEGSPRSLDIKIEAGTAIVVSGDIATVLGSGPAHIRARAPDGAVEATRIPAGRRYDLRQRVALWR
jgi:cyanophycinase